MANFADGVPRLVALGLAAVFLSVVPPESLFSGPDLCLWRDLFHLSACPACGTTRALCAFFHGQFAAALAFNRNVLVTAPAILVMLARDVVRALKP